MVAKPAIQVAHGLAHFACRVVSLIPIRIAMLVLAVAPAGRFRVKTGPRAGPPATSGAEGRADEIRAKADIALSSGRRGVPMVSATGTGPTAAGVQRWAGLT